MLDGRRQNNCGQLGRAITAWQKTLELMPGNAEALRALAGTRPSGDPGQIPPLLVTR